MAIPFLAPSILSADFTHLDESIKRIEADGGAIVHIDIMDGQFVPEISFGQQIVRAVRPLTALPFDVHLMVSHPEMQIESFAQAGADWITFHAESTIHQHRLAQRIHDLGKKAGISIVPSTPVSGISAMLPFVDLVLVMGVNPGFGGQKIIPACIDKIRQLVDIRQANEYTYHIAFDGGVNETTVGTVVSAGADIVISGSSFFRGC